MRGAAPGSVPGHRGQRCALCGLGAHAPAEQRSNKYIDVTTYENDPWLEGNKTWWMNGFGGEEGFLGGVVRKSLRREAVEGETWKIGRGQPCCGLGQRYSQQRE